MVKRKKGKAHYERDKVIHQEKLKSNITAANTASLENTLAQKITHDNSSISSTLFTLLGAAGSTKSILGYTTKLTTAPAIAITGMTATALQFFLQPTNDTESSASQLRNVFRNIMGAQPSNSILSKERVALTGLALDSALSKKQHAALVDKIHSDIPIEKQQEILELLRSDKLTIPHMCDFLNQHSPNLMEIMQNNLKSLPEDTIKNELVPLLFMQADQLTALLHLLEKPRMNSEIPNASHKAHIKHTIAPLVQNASTATSASIKAIDMLYAGASAVQDGVGSAIQNITSGIAKGFNDTANLISNNPHAAPALGGLGAGLGAATLAKGSGYSKTASAIAGIGVAAATIGIIIAAPVVPATLAGSAAILPLVTVANTARTLFTQTRNIARNIQAIKQESQLLTIDSSASKRIFGKLPKTLSDNYLKEIQKIPKKEQGYLINKSQDNTLTIQQAGTIINKYAPNLLEQMRKDILALDNKLQTQIIKSFITNTDQVNVFLHMLKESGKKDLGSAKPVIGKFTGDESSRGSARTGPQI